MKRICIIFFLKCFGISTEVEERITSNELSSPVPNSNSSNTNINF